MTAEDEDGESRNETHLLTRPVATIQLLTPEYRWEFTRRHPYYLMFWREARRHCQTPSEDEFQAAMDEASKAILLLIGVTGLPEDPATPFAQLAKHPLPQAWENGAIAPISIRALASCFLFLPSQVRQVIGRLLLDSIAATGERNEQVLQAHRLMQLQDPVLDQFPDIPLVSINLQSPQRAIVAAIEAYVREEKERRGIPEQRRHDALLPDYLAAWDRHEGWTGASYDGARDQTLQEISLELGVPVGTVRNHYFAAFRLITGHDYQPELWDRTFGELKVRGIFGDTSSSWRSLRRPRRSRALRPVPISRLMKDGNVTNALDAIYARANEVGASHQDTADLYADIRSLISAHATNAEIIQELDMKSEMADALIDAIRSRWDENI